jgi:cytochrome c nitrite reductase small subunit
MSRKDMSCVIVYSTLNCIKLDKRAVKNGVMVINKARLLKLTILISGAGLVILILSVLGMKVTSKPAFCANCHEIKPAVVAWSVNPHKGVECLECHADPGFSGYVKRKVGGLGEVYKHLTNSYDPDIKAKVNTASCIVCHSGEKASKYPKAKNITLSSGDSAPSMPHEDMLKNKTSCLDCHRDRAHGNLASAQTQK